MKLIVKSLIPIILSLLTLTTDLQAQFEKETIEIEFHSCDIEHDGSVEDARIRLRTNLGWGPYIDIDRLIDGDGFERNAITKIKFSHVKFSNLETIELSYDEEQNVENEMYLEKVVLRKPNGQSFLLNINCGWRNGFPYNGNFELIEYKEPAANETFRMRVLVKTGTDSGAGTDANVSITLNTDWGIGPTKVLNPLISRNAFENGDEDVFSFDHKVFKEIKSIIISHDNSYRKADWQLDKIQINTPEGKTIHFDCDCLLEGPSNALTLYPVAKSIDDKYYIESAISYRVIDVAYGSTKNGTPIQLMNRKFNDAQTFSLEDAGDSYFYIKSNLASNKYLHIEGVSNQPKARVVLWDGKGGDNTKWAFIKMPDDYYLIQSKLGTYLDVQWGDSELGTPIWMWTQNAGLAQQWKLLDEKQRVVYPPEIKGIYLKY